MEENAPDVSLPGPTPLSAPSILNSTPSGHFKLIATPAEPDLNSNRARRNLEIDFAEMKHDILQAGAETRSQAQVDLAAKKTAEQTNDSAKQADDSPTPNSDEDEEVADALAESKKSEESVELFKMNTDSVNSAMRSIVVAAHRRASLLLPIQQVEGKQSFRIEHHARVIFDPSAARLPLYSDMPHLVWRASDLPPSAASDSRSKALTPHWILPTRADMHCIPQALEVACEPEELTDVPRNAATGLPVDRAKDVARIKAERKLVATWMTEAKAEAPDGDQFKQLCQAFGFTFGSGSDAQKKFDESFTVARDLIDSDAAVDSDRYIAAEAFRRASFIEECRYRAVDEPEAIGWAGDFDAANGIVSSSSHYTFPPKISDGTLPFPIFSDSEFHRASILQYYRHPITAPSRETQHPLHEPSLMSSRCCLLQSISSQRIIL